MPRVFWSNQRGPAELTASQMWHPSMERSHCETGTWLQGESAPVCHGLASSAQAWGKGDCWASGEVRTPGL